VASCRLSSGQPIAVQRMSMVAKRAARRLYVIANARI
jgi:hypothetical protein